MPPVHKSCGIDHFRKSRESTDYSTTDADIGLLVRLGGYNPQINLLDHQRYAVNTPTPA